MVQLYATVVSMWLSAGHRLQQKTKDETGANAVEYAIIVAIGFAVATLIGVTITAVVNSRMNGIN
jgi:Flp pilus assembly pilin Flp